MYKRAKNLMCLALIVAVSTLLSACGGAPADENTAASRLSEPAMGNQRSSLNFVASSKSESVAPASSEASEYSAPKSSAPNIDAIAPSPTSLQVDELSQDSVTLLWSKAQDNVGISHYKILRNGTFIATVGSSDQVLTDNNLTQLTDYKYTIIAVDLAGNSSPSSAELSVRTLPSSSSSQASSLIQAIPAQLQSSSQNSIPASSNASSVASTTSSKTASSLVSTSSAKTSSSVTSSTMSSVSSLPVSSRASSVSSLPVSSRASSISSLSSSRASSTSSLSSSRASSTSSLSMSSSSRSSAAASSASPRSAKLTWSHPTQRENEQYLDWSEIGGYEIRYRKSTDTHYTYVVINGNDITEYTHPNADGIEFEIAVFDNNGVYSRFVKVE